MLWLGAGLPSAICFLGGDTLFSPFGESKSEETGAVSNLPQQEDVRTKVSKGIGELFYNAVT